MIRITIGDALLLPRATLWAVSGEQAEMAGDLAWKVDLAERYAHQDQRESPGFKSRVARNLRTSFFSVFYTCLIFEHEGHPIFVIDERRVRDLVREGQPIRTELLPLLRCQRRADLVVEGEIERAIPCRGRVFKAAKGVHCKRARIRVHGQDKRVSNPIEEGCTGSSLRNGANG